MCLALSALCEGTWYRGLRLHLFMNLGEGCYLELVTLRSLVQIYSIKFFSLGKAISSLVDIKRRGLCWIAQDLISLSLKYSERIDLIVS